MRFLWTRLMLWSVLVLGAAAGLLAQNNPTNIGPVSTTYQDDIGATVAPALPSGGRCRRYFNLNTGLETWVNSGGANCAPTGGGGGNQLPGYSTAQYGTTGNGSTDDTAAFQTAINACPQSSPAIGCDIYAPAGLYNTTSALDLALLKGVHLHGSGAGGTGGCSTIIQTHGAIKAFNIGNGSSPNTSGFLIENICFQDMTGNGLGGIDIQATRDGVLNNVGCLSYLTGYCVLTDGGSNFTQFIHMYNVFTWHSKYGILTANKTASNFVWGGEFNCQNAGSTDIISGSRAIDLGYTNHSAATGTASEWSVDTQSQNCEIGIALFNAGANHFWGKAVEETIAARPNNSFGVRVDGDTPSLANGNVFDEVQVTKAGTAFYLAPNTNNTIINPPVFNGTNGVDLVADVGALGSTKLSVNKRLTGWQTNISDITRSGNVVTAHTTANSDNGDLSVMTGTLLSVFNAQGGTTSFNGQFPAASVVTNDLTGITTLTWNQTGANESGTINATACGGLGTCIGALSTVLSSGVGVTEVTGDQDTQDRVYQVPTIPNQGKLPQTCTSTTGRTFFDGAFFDVCEAGSGILHLSDGPTVSYNGNASGSYSPQPTIFAGGVGTVNTNGTTTVTYSSGNTFNPAWTGTITINNIVYTIASVSTSGLTLTTTATVPTQTGVNYETSGFAGVPNCGNPSGGICLTSDDKGFLYANNTNGSTYCLPPPGAAKGYPPGFKHVISFAPGTGGNPFSITPPGVTSSLGVACPGAAGPLFDGSPTFTNITNLQGMTIYTDGNNWKSSRGAPNVALDQIQNALSSTSTNLNPLKSGSFTGGGAGANNGQDWSEQGGSSNSSGGRGADRGNISGPDSASGKNGAVYLDQTFNSGNGLGGKNGFIVRACRDITGTDCSNLVPAGNSGAVRLTVSGTDVAGPIGIVSSGSGTGSPSQIRVSGVYGHDITDGAVVETNCTAGQYYEIAETSALDNGAGQCTSTDSPRRVGIALLAVSGCSQGSPCHVPVLVQPGAGLGQLIQTGTDGACTTSCTETFPIAYQSAVPKCYCTGINGSCNIQTGGNASKLTCAFNASASGGINWWAIGAP